MFKKIAPFLILFATTLSWSQHKFESFSFNDLMGIVEIETLQEYRSPFVESRKEIKFNSDFIAYRDSSNFLKTISKFDGDSLREVKIPKWYPVTQIDGFNYINTYENNKSVILDSLLNTKYRLDEKYSRFVQVDKNSDFFYGIRNDSTYILKRQNDELHVYQNIAGDSFTEATKLYNNGKKAKVYVVYNNSVMHVFDQDFNLIEKIAGNGYGYRSIDQVINREYYKDRVIMVTNEPPPHRAVPKPPQEFIELSPLNGKSRYAAPAGDIIISVCSSCKLISKDSKEFFVQNVEKTVEKIENGTKTTYGGDKFNFRIGSISKKVLLPLKYQSIIEIEVSMK